jgi:MOSC domain-containing protein YiiM
MQVVSVNVGLPREVAWKGETVTTGIFKEPVAGQVMMRTLNLDGDRQADLSVHGGPDKAVYLYPSEHYAFWSRELPEMRLPWGVFGENITTEGLREDEVHIGDRFRIGQAEVMITQPRIPCYKLGIRFGRDDIIKRFLHSGRSGFYAAVLRDGEVEAGDAIEPIGQDATGVSVAEFNRLFVTDKNNGDLLRRVLRLAAVPEGWRDCFRQRLDKLGR